MEVAVSTPSLPESPVLRARGSSPIESPRQDGDVQTRRQLEAPAASVGYFQCLFKRAAEEKPEDPRAFILGELTKLINVEEAQTGSTSIRPARLEEFAEQAVGLIEAARSSAPEGSTNEAELEQKRLEGCVWAAAQFSQVMKDAPMEANADITRRMEEATLSTNTLWRERFTCAASQLVEAIHATPPIQPCAATSADGGNTWLDTSAAAATRLLEAAEHVPQSLETELAGRIEAVTADLSLAWQERFDSSMRVFEANAKSRAKDSSGNELCPHVPSVRIRLREALEGAALSGDLQQYLVQAVMEASPGQPPAATADVVSELRSTLKDTIEKAALSGTLEQLLQKEEKQGQVQSLAQLQEWRRNFRDSLEKAVDSGRLASYFRTAMAEAGQAVEQEAGTHWKGQAELRGIGAVQATEESLRPLAAAAEGDDLRISLRVALEDAVQSGTLHRLLEAELQKSGQLSIQQGQLTLVPAKLKVPPVEPPQAATEKPVASAEVPSAVPRSFLPEAMEKSRQRIKEISGILDRSYLESSSKAMVLKAAHAHAVAQPNGIASAVSSQTVRGIDEAMEKTRQRIKEISGMMDRSYLESRKKAPAIEAAAPPTEPSVLSSAAVGREARTIDEAMEKARQRIKEISGMMDSSYLQSRKVTALESAAAAVPQPSVAVTSSSSSAVIGQEARTIDKAMEKARQRIKKISGMIDRSYLLSRKMPAVPAQAPHLPEAAVTRKAEQRCPIAPSETPTASEDDKECPLAPPEPPAAAEPHRPLRDEARQRCPVAPPETPVAAGSDKEKRCTASSSAVGETESRSQAAPCSENGHEECPSAPPESQPLAAHLSTKVDIAASAVATEQRVAEHEDAQSASGLTVLSLQQANSAPEPASVVETTISEEAADAFFSVDQLRAATLGRQPSAWMTPAAEEGNGCAGEADVAAPAASRSASGEARAEKPCQASVKLPALAAPPQKRRSKPTAAMVLRPQLQKMQATVQDLQRDHERMAGMLQAMHTEALSISSEQQRIASALDKPA